VILDQAGFDFNSAPRSVQTSLEPTGQMHFGHAPR